MNPFPRIFNTTLFSPLLQCGPSWGMLYEEVRLAMRCGATLRSEKRTFI